MGKTIALFHLGKTPLEQGMQIVAAHIDSPRLDLKQHPLYEERGMAYFDTHYYGGIKKYRTVCITHSRSVFPAFKKTLYCAATVSSCVTCFSSYDIQALFCIIYRSFFIYGKKNIFNKEKREEILKDKELLSLSSPISWQCPTLPRKEYAVPSAQEDLTSVFGMDTGVTPPPLSPGNLSFFSFLSLSSSLLPKDSLKTTQCITFSNPFFPWSSPRPISIS